MTSEANMNASQDTGSRRWTIVHQLLHWLVAAAVIYQLTLGFDLGDLADDDPQRLALLRLHATTGVTILVLMLLRLGWRLSHEVLPPPTSLGPKLAAGARIIHRAFYVALLMLPVSGLLLVAASSDHVPLVGFDLPGFSPTPEWLRTTLWILHAVFAIATSIMVLLHIGAALRHAFLRDGTLSRMLPWK